MRIGLVLSAGGLRGAAHLGVMRKLLAHDIPIDVIVGASAGAVVAAYYAAVGLTVDEFIDDARGFKGRHLVAHSLAQRVVTASLAQRAWSPLTSLVRGWSGVIPQRLAQLQAGRFDRLHHGVSCLGVVCHDLTHRRPRYLSTVSDGGVRLYEAVAASASVPNMFPPLPVTYDGVVCQFTDGGLSDSLPVRFAGQPGLDAKRVIVSDCRRHRSSEGRVDRLQTDAAVIYLRPDLHRTSTLRAPRASLLEAVEAGEATVTDEVISKVRQWTATAKRSRRPVGPPRGSS